MSTVIAVDAMGGDFGPAVTVPAVLKSLRQFNDLKIILVGDSSQIEPFLDKIPDKYQSRISLEHAENDVDQTLLGTFSAVRNKPNSPIGVAVELVRSQRVDALVSAGHTSFLMASSTYRLKRIPGLSRPAICTLIPTTKGFSFLLDVGANLECDAENLYEFSIMGSLLAKAVSKNRQPKVALLNIGSEVVKGTNNIKVAAGLIEHNPFLNYIGFIEGHDLFNGLADVIVCDGFSGNIALKASEGAALFINETLRSSISSTWLRKVVASFSYPLFSELKKRLNPQSFNGAVLLGVQGIVVKSHGHADAYGFSNAIRQAVYASQADLLSAIREKFESSII